MKHIVISAQMGAVSNLVKNIVLLSPDIYWPLEQDRLQVVLNQYNPILKQDKSTWVSLEVALNQRMGNYFLMDMDYRSVQDKLPGDRPAAFINHSLFWDLPVDFDQQLNFLDVVFVMPSTEFGLEWQTRAATEKVMIPNLEHHYDFCFDPADKQVKLPQYIQQHGEKNYIKFNVHSMRQVFKQQQDTLRAQAINCPVLCLEDIILGSAQLIHHNITQALNISLAVDQVHQVLHAWRSLHWAPEHTFNWPYTWSTNMDFPNE